MVLEHFYPYKGGVEFLFLHLGKQLLAQGHSVAIVTTLHDEKLPAKEIVDGLKIYRVKCRNRFLYSIWSIPTVYKVAKDCDIIQTSTYAAAFPAWVSAKLRRKKVVLTFHEYWGELWSRLPYLGIVERNIYKVYEKIISGLPYHKIVAVSNFTKKALMESGVNSSKISVIYNGLDYKEIKDIKTKIQSLHLPHDEVKYILFVGRLGVSKGFDIMIPGVDDFLIDHPNYKFLMIIPDYPENMCDIVNGLIDKMKAKQRVIKLTNLDRDHLYRYMTRSEAILIPSYSEGFCFVAAEAQALGVPIISSGLGALEEVVNRTHITMMNHNQQGMYEALLRMNQNEWSVGNGRMYTLANTVQEYLNLYKTMVHEK